MYRHLSSRMIKIRNSIYAQRRRRLRRKKLRAQKRLIKQVGLAFIGITGTIFIWSAIARYAEANLTMGDSLALGFGLLLFSGLLTRRFVKTFS